jgi:hypothetical protein
VEQSALEKQEITQLREAGQCLAEAIRMRDGEAALRLAVRYEKALHAALAAEESGRDALICEASDWLQEKIVAAIRIRAEISSEIHEIESKKKLMGSPGGAGSGEACSFVA